MMFEITRKRLAGILSALAMTLVLVLVLATVAFAGSPIVNRVNAGSPDLCEALSLSPGCNANFSLSAREYADGSVKGQYTDQFGHGFGGFHADIDCLVVVGDVAWVSGVITHGAIHPPVGEDVDLAGLGVSTRVADNGTSTKDPADQISFSVIEDDPFSPFVFAVCTDKPGYPLVDISKGQVKVD